VICSRRRSTTDTLYTPDICICITFCGGHLFELPLIICRWQAIRHIAYARPYTNVLLISIEDYKDEKKKEREKKRRKENEQKDRTWKKEA
jgi:hypothetical protein